MFVGRAARRMSGDGKSGTQGQGVTRAEEGIGLGQG